MKVVLVYPPNRNVPSSPYGALPLLAGCLKAEGHVCQIVDANLEVFDQLIRHETVAGIQAHFDAAWAHLRGKETLLPHEARLLQGMAELAVVPFERLHEAEEAAHALRTAELFDEPENVNRAYDTIANLLRTAYALNPIYYLLKPGALDEFFAYLERPLDNPIAKLVEAHVIDQILAAEPDLVAVSIPFNEQFVECFALLKQLKQRAPHIKTLVGGAIVSAYADKLCADPRFYEYADFGMPGEADLAFPRFCTALENDVDLTQCANLWMRDSEGTIHPPPSKELPNLNEIATPDFSSVPIGRYLLPDTIANYQTSRGCYYGKCTFCSFDIKQNFRFRRAELVQQDIEAIQEQTGLKHFIFWDPLTPPRLMKAVAKWNKDRGDKKIYWGAETKFEKFFTQQEFTDLLYEGGARFMQFGFESGSQRLLDLMVKGNDLSRVGMMLDAMDQSGLKVSVQWFTGFPTATEQEDRDSFRFLDRYRDVVVSSSYMGTFTLSPDDDIYRSGGDLYDLDIFQREDGAYDYKHRDGQTHYDRAELHAAYMARGDMESVTRMAFYIYLTRQPERVKEILNFTRGGELPDTWEEMAGAQPELPDANYLAEYDFDVFTPVEEQGIGPEGGKLRARTSRAAFVTQTQLVYPLSEAGMAMLKAADGVKTSEELVAGVEGDRDVLRTTLLEFVRLGVLRIPLRVREKKAASPAA